MIFINRCVLLLAILTGCSLNPEPVVYGKDNCEHCLMQITDPKYGAELVTTKGKIFKFDSIECLAAYYSKENPENISSCWVTDFNKPQSLINYQNALFIKSNNLKSPMGLNLSAYSDENSLHTIIDNFGGTEFNWSEILDHVEKEWNEN